MRKFRKGISNSSFVQYLQFIRPSYEKKHCYLSVETLFYSTLACVFPI